MRALALIVAAAGVGLFSTAVSAQAAPTYAQDPVETLARNVRILAADSQNFDALVAAGRAALETGDPEAAAAFFGRAEEVNPNSYLPPAGMGAAFAATGDANQSLIYFARAQQLGATAAAIGADRGLAYDLLGQQAAAQSDYRAALLGPEREDARRRLALSLAISGDEAAALTTLQPLLLRDDPASKRDRALILALGGDIAGAKTALDYMMPGASARMAPFFRRLSALSPAQKAAAVHLGIFPESDAPTYAAADTPTSAELSGASDDRLASIERLLRRTPDSAPAQPAPVQQADMPAATPQSAPVQYSAPPEYSSPVEVASISRREIQRAENPDSPVEIARVAADPGARRIWLQLASGDAAQFPYEFQRIRSRDPSLFADISGYVADDGQRARLVIGPFHSSEDARLFAEALSSDSIDSFNWSSDPNQPVTRLPGQ